MFQTNTAKVGLLYSNDSKLQGTIDGDRVEIEEQDQSDKGL